MFKCVPKYKFSLTKQVNKVHRSQDKEQQIHKSEIIKKVTEFDYITNDLLYCMRVVENFCSG